MFKYILICSFLAHNIWAKPLRSHADVAPHVLILTPQAQLRLESLVPGAPIIQHLTPFTSYLAPHEETVVYVPASAAAAVHNAELFARSIQGKRAQISPAEFQGAFSQALSTGLTAASNAIGQAFATAPTSFTPGEIGSNIVTALVGSFPPSQSATGTPSQDLSQEQSQEQAQKLLQAHQLQEQQQLQLQHQKETQELQQQQLLELQQKQQKPSLAADIAISPIITASDTKLPTISLATKIPNVPQLISPIIPSISLFGNEPRHHYVVAPVAPHVVDIVPNTVYLSPSVTNTIKARRSVTNENKEANPLTAIILPAIAKPEALPLKNDLEKPEQLNKDKQEEEFKRFLEADALKEESRLDNSGDILDKTLQTSENKPTNAAHKLAEVNPNESSPKIEAISDVEPQNDTPQTKDIKIEN